MRTQFSDEEGGGVVSGADSAEFAYFFTEPMHHQITAWEFCCSELLSRRFVGIWGIAKVAKSQIIAGHLE